MHTTHDLVIVGGGLAGLTAAAFATRAGATVKLLERSSHLGGRAHTIEVEGFDLDLGPHALYRQGAGMSALDALGVTPRGGAPVVSGVGVRADHIGPLPMGMWSLLTTSLLKGRGRWQFMGVMARLGRMETSRWSHTTWGTWLDDHFTAPDARALMAAFGRLSTYTHAPDHISAAVVLDQIRMGLGGVLYLDGGWRRLVDDLTASAGAGLELHTGCGVTTIHGEAGAFEVEDRTGVRHRGRQLVLATGPGVVDSLMGTTYRTQLCPSKAACLAVGMHTRGLSGAHFALGLDAPMYLSEFTRAAKVAPADHAVVHVARYLSPTEDGPARNRVPGEDGHTDTLEGMLTRQHPHWRDHMVVKKRLGKMTVLPAIPMAISGGLAGRPEAHVAPGITLAGDWVGPEGLLADAALASGRAAATLALEALNLDAAPRQAVA
ncbi:MAG: FAD-dependent oxidoreductase [Bradymonadia bacterium]